MKGSMTDIPLILLGVFAVALSIFFGQTLLTEIDSSGTLNTTVIGADVISDAQIAFTVFDGAFLFLIVGLAIGSGISAFFVRTHPLFFILSMVVWIISFVLAALFSNIFVIIAAEGPLLTASAILTNIVTVMSNLPVLVAVIGVIIVLALYAKGRFGSNDRSF